MLANGMRGAIAGLLLAGLAGAAHGESTEAASIAVMIGEYGEAYNLVRPRADSGDPDAQYFLGRMYDNGQGLPENFTEAARWYRKAAMQGNARAQFDLGQLYLFGSGVPQDNIEVFKWMDIAAFGTEPGDSARWPAESNWDRVYAVEMRRLVSLTLSADELTEAYRRISEFLADYRRRIGDESVSNPPPAALATAEIQFHLVRLGILEGASGQYSMSSSDGEDLQKIVATIQTGLGLPSDGIPGFDFLERLRRQISTRRVTPRLP